MAKKSMMARTKKRAKLIKQYQAKREQLKRAILKAEDFESMHDAQVKLQKMPIDSSRVRLNKCCQQCGRPHAVYKKFGLCRICLRQQLMNGNVPGGKKASW